MAAAGTEPRAAADSSKPPPPPPALQQAPRRNPYAKMLRREKGYYEHLARRLSRYLSALAD